MLVQVPQYGYVRRTRRLRGLRGFGELPDPNTYSRNGGFFTAKADGLGSIPNFFSRYEAARALSREVDAIRSEREASTLGSTEKTIAARLNQALKDAAYNFEWDIGWPVKWDRSKERWSKLRAALAGVDAALNDYNGRIPPLLNSARTAIQARIAAEQRAAQAEIEAKAAAAEAKAAAEAAAAATALIQATTEQKAVVDAQTALIASQAEAALEVQKARAEVAKASAPKLAGMSYGMVAGLGVAAAAGIYWMSTQGKKRR